MSRASHDQGSVVRPKRTGLRRLLSPLFVILCAFLVASGGAAYGFWSTSATGTAQSQSELLNTPGPGTATSPSGTSLVISWGSSSGLPSPHGGYQVLRSTVSGGPYSAIISGTCNQNITEGSTATTCTDTGLTPGTTYFYEVVATYYVTTTLWTSAPTAQFSGATTKVTPAITTTATPASVTVGGSASDQASVTGGFNPTGTISWSLYSNSGCSGTAVFTTSNGGTVSGDSTYTSDSYTTTAVGTYTWAFSYTGDTSNNAVSACGGTGETLTVNKATPTLGTSASTNVSVGQSVSDTATLGNGYNPSGTITYTLYGPNTTVSCATQVGQVTSAVTGNGTYPSPAITPPTAGTYWWIANYGGDTNNSATTNTCGATGETSVINKVTPTITTTATPSTVTVGGSVADQATVGGGFSPTGLLTWSLYNNSSCSGTAVFTTSGGGNVSGDKVYTSNSFTTTAAGTFTWQVSYNGDINNNPVTVCGGTGEQVIVNLALSPSTLPAGTVGAIYGPQTITATGGTGSVTFSVTSGNLAAGLTLNSSTGVISGTPTAGGSFSFTVTATDSATPTHNTGSQAYTLVVNPPTIVLSPTTLPNGSTSSSYNQTITASGGTSPYSFAVTSGTFPPGLHLASGGAITGTPTATGTFTFAVTATDFSTGTGPYTGSQSYTVKITGAPTFVQSGEASSSSRAGSATVTLSSNVSSGDALVLVADIGTHSTPTVLSVSGGGVTWTSAAGTGNTSSHGDSEIWYGLASSGGSKTITVNFTDSSTQYNLVMVSEWSGISSYDKSASTTGTSTSVSAGSITPARGGEVIISGAEVEKNATGITPSNGFTTFPNGQQAPTSSEAGYSAYLIDSSSSSISTTWTESSSVGWASAIAAFSP